MKAPNFTTKCASLLFALAMVSGPQALADEKWTLDLSQGDGKVEFFAEGAPKALNIHGEGGAPKGVLKVDGGKVSGKATFDLNTLDTQMDLRNEHMKEKYLETEKYPTATLEITEIKLPAMKSDFEKSVPFKGNMTVHGTSQAVKGTAKLKKSGSKLNAEVEFMTSIKGFKIDVPSFAGITVKDPVKVKVGFTAPLSSGGASVRGLATKKK